MATLPEVVGFDTDIVVASQPSKTWIIDRNTMQVSCMDKGLEAVRQAVEIALNVERYRWTIYSANYGSELDGLVGEDEAYIIAEIPRLIEGALSPDSRVVSVELDRDHHRFIQQCVGKLLRSEECGVRSENTPTTDISPSSFP